MQAKGQQGKTVVARVGEIEWERSYSYGPAYEQGLFPLDAQLQLHEQRWSEPAAKQAVGLYGQVEEEVVEEIMRTIGG